MASRLTRTCDYGGCTVVVAYIVKAGPIVCITSTPSRATTRPNEFRCFAHRPEHQKYAKVFYGTVIQDADCYVFTLYRALKHGMQEALQRKVPRNNSFAVSAAIEELDSYAALCNHYVEGDQTWRLLRTRADRAR